MKHKISDLTTVNNSDVRLTPDWILDEIVYPTLGTVDIDPTAESQINPNVKATRHFTIDNPATDEDLVGTVFMNPPFSGSKGFLAMVNRAIDKGTLSQAVVLIKFDARTNWMQKYVWDSQYVDWIYFTRYVKFKTIENGEMSPAPFSVCLVNFNHSTCDNWSRFYDVTNERFEGKVIPMSKRACKFILGN